jgi:hypothetical protein
MKQFKEIAEFLKGDGDDIGVQVKMNPETNKLGTWWGEMTRCDARLDTEKVKQKKKLIP